MINNRLKHIFMVIHIIYLKKKKTFRPFLENNCIKFMTSKLHEITLNDMRTLISRRLSSHTAHRLD